MRIGILAVGILVVSLLGACATASKQPESDSATQTPAEVNTQLGIAYMRSKYCPRGPRRARPSSLTASRGGPILQTRRPTEI